LTDNRNHRLRRARPVIALAAVAFLVGAVVGAQRGGSPALRVADRFTAAWANGDYRAMYEDIDARTRRSTTLAEFEHEYRGALRTATALGERVLGRARAVAGSRIQVPVSVRTRLWGTLKLSFTLPTVSEADEGGVRIAWSRELAFPGMRAGESLSRRTYLPRRATLLARDGSVLAESPPGGGAHLSSEETRNSPLGSFANAVLGTVGPPPATRRSALEAEGVPSDGEVGLSGLESALDRRLRGTPGGDLLAGGRMLASTLARSAPPLRTTVSPAIQQSAVTALGGQLGGIVAMKPGSGELLAVAGIGLNGLQPPGSTFKILTLTGVLEHHVATPRTVFPYATYAVLDGVKLSNANGEDCGGSLELAFAVSCNSVFTPLGVKLGADRLVEEAEKFGFNHDPGVAGASESTLPQASAIEGELALGSTAIGQGEVLATPLEMATVAATIADGGHRPTPSFLPTHPHPGPAATSSHVARTVRRLMTLVVREGTGRSAAIPGVVVAGKTGTAELKTPCRESASSSEEEGGHAGSEQSASCQHPEEEASNTDAWFTAFAPAIRPRVVVCVMLVKDGAGGDTAAPVAREVLEAALSAH
jgi:penicillin-binding protein A